MTDTKKQGRIVIPSGTHPWPHEFRMAEVLSNNGHEVEFIVKNEGEKIHSADIVLDGELWEMKAPNGKTLDSVERNLRRGSKQSNKIIFASWRMKRIPDIAILRELKTQATKVSGVSKIKFINRQEKIIDIK